MDVDAGDLLTLREAAELTELTPQALARRVERGSLPATKGKDGLRRVRVRALAEAGLLDLRTMRPPTWTTRGRPPADELARAVLEELTARGVRIYELERRLEQVERQLEEARHERAELRRRLDSRPE